MEKKTQKRGIENIKVNRHYACQNKLCGCELAFEELATKKFRVKCPLCLTNSLLMICGDLPFSIVMGLNQPKTIGALSQANVKRFEKEGHINKEKRFKTPWWRKNKKYNFKILKNPASYISEGTY